MARCVGLLAVSSLLIAVPAAGADGVFEINQACVNTGCFAGDGPGPPVVINAQGSYRLTSNLLGPNGVTAISIQSDDVELDLGGFTVGPCVNVQALCPILQIEDGISAPAASNVTLRNGVVEDFRRSGVVLGQNARVVDVTVQGNDRFGIQTSTAAVVRGCIAADSGETGFLLGEESTAQGNLARQNGANGFSVGGSSVVRGNVASRNEGAGFSVGTGSTVVHNSANSNGGDGFSLSSGSTILNSGGLARSNTAIGNGGFGFDNGVLSSQVLLPVKSWGLVDNVANDNNDGGDQIRGGVEMGQNVCENDLTCP